MSGSPVTLDTPGTTCHFDSNGCTATMLGHGGFDQHHAIPIELGGDPNQPLLPLCPNHHRRAHALLRYLIECVEAGVERDWAVLEHFVSAERQVALAALDAWVSFGRPPIPGWPCPAARA